MLYVKGGGGRNRCPAEGCGDENMKEGQTSVKAKNHRGWVR